MSKQVRLPDGTVITDCFSDPQDTAPAALTRDHSGRLSLGQSRVPDVLECLANLSSDEVFTPPRIANEMLDLLPAEVWADPTLRWLDPGCKSGVFLREAARRLMVGLADVIPDPDERRHHIFTEMLHGYAITELTAMISRRTLYYTKDATSEDHAVVAMPTPEGNVRFDRSNHTFKNGSCAVCGASEVIERGTELENHAYAFIHGADTAEVKFDVVIGNPPYQLDSGGYGAQATPLYHLFVQRAIDMGARYVSFIVPARWYAGGMGLDDFRAKMLADRRMCELVDFPDAAECFPDVEIKGGVCYFLWDARYDGPCKVTNVVGGSVEAVLERSLGDYDVFVRYNKALSVLEKVLAGKDGTASDWVSATQPFGLPTNFADWTKSKTAKSIRLYMKGTGDGAPREGWVHKDRIKSGLQLVDQHKVLISKAYNGGDSFPHQIVGAPIVVKPASACTMTYLVAGAFASSAEAENLAAFLRTRFARFMISLRKNTQHVSRSSFAFVPKLDMTVRWTDQMLYQRYGLTQDEIDFIESRIKEMN